MQKSKREGFCSLLNQLPGYSRTQVLAPCVPHVAQEGKEECVHLCPDCAKHWLSEALKDWPVPRSRFVDSTKLLSFCIFRATKWLNSSFIMPGPVSAGMWRGSRLRWLHW